MRVKFLSFLLILLCSVRLYANPVVALNGFKSANSNKYVQFLLDEKGKLTCQEILSGRYNHQFYYTPGHSTNLGFSILPHWAKVEFENKSDITNFIVEIESTYLDSIAFFEVRNGNIKASKDKNQLFFNPNASSVLRSTSTYAFQLNKGEKVTFLMRFRSATSLNFPVLFYTDLEFQNYNAKKQALYAVTTGVIFFVFMFSLFLFFTIKENTYLYYCSYVFAFWFFLSCSNGYLYAYFPVKMYDMRLISGLSIVFFMLLFTRDFLLIKKFNKKILYATKLIFYALGVCAFVYLLVKLQIVNLLTNQQAFKIMGIIYSLVFAAVYVVVILSIIAALRRKYLPGWFYFIALAPVFVLALVMLLANLAILPIKQSFDILFAFAYLFEISVLCLALAFRFKLYKDNEQKLLLDNSKKEKEILTSLIAGQEMERKRIAEELHDSLGQQMAVTKLKLEGLNLFIPQHDVIDNLKKHVDESIKELRNISYNMMPVALINNSLNDSIKDLIANINFSGKIQIEYHSDQTMSRINNTQTEISIYRIIQEALTNIVKHSKAKFASVQITADDVYLQIMIEDDGIGFDTDKIEVGKGLKNISSRVELIQGNLEINTEAGQGTVLFIELPFQA